MINHNKLVYMLVFLICATALIYFLAAYHDSEGLGNPGSNLQEIFADQIELTLFIIVGFGYIGMAIWILIKKINTVVPYIITMVGSILLISIYLLAITIGVPLVGVENESDVLATLSKILQGSIISIIVILIYSVVSNKSAHKVKANSENCILCGKQINDKLPSVGVRIPDGTIYMFDSDICMKNFQKLGSVYGNDNLM